MKLLTKVLAVTASMIGLLFGASNVAADPYISMGDSSSTTGTYVSMLYSGFDEHPGFVETLGVDEHVSLAQGGQVLSGLRAEQLPAALAEIDAEDDTKAVTIGIGGNEGLGGCFTPTSACGTFGANYEDMLSQVKTALADDPGEEFFVVLAYFNPKNGLAQEVDFDHRLLGPNLTADQCPDGTTAGLNDAIMQAASAQGIQAGNAYPSFKEHGQAYIGPDQIHPNADGNEAIAEAFLAPLDPAECVDPPDPTCETDPTLPGCTDPLPCEVDPSLPGCTDPLPCEENPSLCRPEDEVAPRTRLVSMKRKGKRTVAFRFRSSEPGTFRCSLDGKPFVQCHSPKTYRKLKRGRHVFRVRAIDEAGNVDRSPVVRRFRIRR